MILFPPFSVAKKKNMSPVADLFIRRHVYEALGGFIKLFSLTEIKTRNEKKKRKKKEKKRGKEDEILLTKMDTLPNGLLNAY